MHCLASATASSFRNARVRRVDREKRGRSGARGIDAHTPLGPLPVRHNVISAISAGFRCHLSGPRYGRPPFEANVAAETKFIPFWRMSLRLRWPGALRTKSAVASTTRAH